MKELFKYGIILGVICVVAGGLLTGTYFLTKNRISALAQAECEASLKEVLPQAEKFEPASLPDKEIYYNAYSREKKLIGIAFPVTAKGYSSNIEVMVGMAIGGEITAIKIISQNETPGLGDRINEVKDDTTIFDALKTKKPKAALKPWFQSQFSHKKLEDFKDIQTITGATISSKAVLDAVKNKAEEFIKLVNSGK